MNILIIEDEPLIADHLANQIIKRHAHGPDCDIDFAQRFDSAHDKLTSGKKYHFIIWDILLHNEPSFDLWKDFPQQCVIVIFSEYPRALEVLAEKIKGDFQGRIVRPFNDDIKKELNENAQNEDTWIVKDKKTIYKSNGIDRIKDSLETAIKRFGAKEVVFYSCIAEEPPLRILQNSIVFISNAISLYTVTRYDGHATAATPKIILGKRKIIALQDAIHISEDSNSDNNGRGLSNYTQARLGITSPFFIHVSVSLIINAFHIKEANVRIRKGYDFVMNTAESTLTRPYKEYILHTKHDYNLVTVEDDEIIQQIKSVRPDLF